MNAIDVIVLGLERNAGMIEMTLADFSDADMLVRPVPAANHAAWQLGHLAAAEFYFADLIGGPKIDLPAGFADKFSNKQTHVDDPGIPKAELLAAFKSARAQTIAWAKSLSPADLEKPMPEKWKMFAHNLGDLLNMTSIHATMHLGQMQVIRRKLGKPILF